MSNQRKEMSAGGVVFRRTKDGIDTLVIDDRFARVSLPKGHQELGETLEETALREIHEETGIVGRIVGEMMGVVQYTFLSDGVEIVKDVYYYLVEAIGGCEQEQTSEINGLRWVPLNEVLELQQRFGYPNNDAIIHAAMMRLRSAK